jgi:hypothetical protein
MKMNTLYAALSGAFLLGAATLAPAQSTPSDPARAAQPRSMENKAAGISGDEYKREKDRVEADAKAAKARCKDMKDNAKDVCMAEAKANEKVAKKELDYKKNPNDKNKADVEKMRAEVAYEVAKEKCEDQKDGQAECKKQAKAEKDRAVAAAKGTTRKVASTNGSAARTGSTAGNTGGSAASSSPSGNISNTMSPSQREPSPNTNVQTQGSSTGAAGSATRPSSGMSGTANTEQNKTGK